MPQNGENARFIKSNQVMEEKDNSKSNTERLIETFAKQMRKYRKQCGYTQQILADTIHVSLDTVKRYESGRYSGIDICLVSIIADALQIEPYMLFKEQEDNVSIELYDAIKSVLRKHGISINDSEY